MYIRAEDTDIAARVYARKQYSYPFLCAPFFRHRGRAETICILSHSDGKETIMIFDAKAAGNRIYQLRSARGVSAVKAALDLGVSESTYRKIENGERGMSSSVLLLICEYYGVTADYILTGRIPYSAAAHELDGVIDALAEIRQKLDPAL